MKITIDDLKIVELINLICNYLDLSDIISFYLAIQLEIPNKYITEISNMETKIVNLEDSLEIQINDKYYLAYKAEISLCNKCHTWEYDIIKSCDFCGYFLCNECDDNIMKYLSCCDYNLCDTCYKTEIKNNNDKCYVCDNLFVAS